MAYLSSNDTRGRIVTIGAVVAVHGTLAVAILTGFAGGIMRQLGENTLIARNYPAPVDTPKPVPSIEPSAAPAPHRQEPRPTAGPNLRKSVV